MARKTLDVTAITNELEHSAFFPASATSTSAVVSPTNPTNPVDSAGSTEPGAMSPGKASPHSTPSRQAQPTAAPVIAPVIAPVMPASTGAARTPNGQVGQEIGTQVSEQVSDQASADASMDASTLAREHAAEHAPSPAPERVLQRVLQAGDLIERLRRRVRHFGKEIVYIRLTPEEKRQLAEIAYTYKSQDIRTSENEIGRIGLNWLLEDYHDNSANSVLAQVLAALNA